MNTPAQPEQPTSKKPAPPIPPGPASKASAAEEARKANIKSDKTSSPGKKTTPPSSVTRPASTPQRAGGLVAVFALLVAIGALAGSFFIWQSVRTSQQQLAELATRNDTMSSEVNSLAALRGTVAQEQDKLGSLGDRFDSLENNQQQINDSIEALHTEVSRDRKSGWMVAEAEYLVRVAGQRLKLTNDVDTAVAALRAADERLKSTGDPSLIEARSVIADEISSLQSVTLPDVTGMALSLSSLENRVNELPLEEPETTAPTPAAETDTTAADGWEAAAAKAWEEIKGLVVITHNGDTGEGPLLTPDQRDLLRQNLRLKLETARLALLNRDTQVFQDSLQTTRHWITTYFRESTPRQQMLDSLAQLQETELSPALPDISQSLQALRNWSNRQPGGTASLPLLSPEATTTGEYRDSRS